MDTIAGYDSALFTFVKVYALSPPRNSAAREDFH